MRIIFRVDASLQIGTGHVMRCLTLADALKAKGADCNFMCRTHEGNLIDLIRSRGHVTYSLPAAATRGASSKPVTCTSAVDLAHSDWLGVTQAEDADNCAQTLASLNPDWLVVDHYALDARWERALAPHYAKLMVIDDLTDRPHACDLLLDQTFGREAKDYHPLVPSACRLLCGSQYALLRPEFDALRPSSLLRRSQPALREVLITMGGVDKGNATGEVLKAMCASTLPSDCRITVVLGATAPWLEQVLNQAQDMPWPTRVLVGVSDMAQLMADSDLAIGAAGSTSWELCCLGVPSLLICVADNQRYVIAALASASAAAQLDLAALKQPDGAPFREQLAKLLNDLGTFSAAGALVTDGRGAEGVSAQLIGLP